jgi:hypothetical protein
MKRDSKGRFIKKYSINENFFNIINEKNSFIIGLMASDGNIRNDKVFSISQSGERGLHLIKTICNWMDFNGVITSNPTTHQTSYTITVTAEKIVNELHKHNITTNKTKTYKFHDEILLKEFLQGYIEGDGCVGIYDSSTTLYYYISFFGNKEFIMEIVKYIPFESKLREINTDYLEIKFLGENGLKFSEWLWQTPVYKESSKYLKFLDFKENYYPKTKYYKYRNLNKLILEMLENGNQPKQIANELNVKVKTVYNLKHNKKNGRGTY